MAVASRTIDVWPIDLDVPGHRVPALLDVLSGDERARAARLRTSELRVRFVVAHGVLRTILARYVGVAPAALRFDATRAGKPFIPGTPVVFNLSHSHALAVCAVTAAGEVGVDLEHVREVHDADAIVRRYFAPGEVRAYEALAPPARAAAFFGGWTRKEAIVKATGEGLSCPLDSFEAGITSAPAHVRVAHGAQVRLWYVRSFEPASGYMGAIASDGLMDLVHRLEFTEPGAP